MKTGIAPLRKALFHFIARFRPPGAYLGKGEIALGELGAAAIDAVEDIDNDIDSLISPNNLVRCQMN